MSKSRITSILNVTPSDLDLCDGLDNVSDNVDDDTNAHSDNTPLNSAVNDVVNTVNSSNNTPELLHSYDPNTNNVSQKIFHLL